MVVDPTRTGPDTTEKQLRRIRGCRPLPRLMAVLDQETDQMTVLPKRRRREAADVGDPLKFNYIRNNLVRSYSR